MAKKKKQKNGGLPTYEEYAQKTGQLKTYDQYTKSLEQKQAQEAEQAKQRQQERVSKMTDLFRDSAAHEQNARYDGTAPSTYAAKMMLDSHSSTEAENERRAKVNAYLTNLKKDREAKQNTSSFSNWMAAKQPANKARKTTGTKTTELEERLQQMGKRPKTVQEGTDQQTEKQRPTTVKDYRTFLGEKKELQKQGAFDNDKDSKWWSDEKLETGRKNVQDQIDVVDSQLDKLKAKQQNKENWYPRTAYSGWSNLYEEMRDGRIRNGRDLLDYTDDEKNISNRARDYFDNVFQNQAEIEDSETGRQRAIERAFNYVYGYSDENSGMYDLVTEGMSEREKAEFDSKLYNIISGMRNPYRNFDYDQEAYGLNSQRDKLSGDLGKWTGEQDRRSRIGELEAGAPDATGIADPEKKYITGGNNAMQFLVNSMTGPQGDDMDKAFWEIRNQQSQWNSMTTAEKIDMLNQLTGSTSHDGLAESLQDTTKAFGQYYAFMTPEQVNTFESYYKTGDKNSARAYLEALRPYLSMYANEYSKYVAEEAAKGDYGLAYGAMSVAQAPMNALVSGIGTVLAAAGNEEAGSENSTWFRGQNIQNAIREGRKEAWGENASRLLGSWAKAPAEFLNGVFYSMADMAVATGIGGALSRTSEISQPLVQFVMSSEAASNTMTEQLERGIDPREAALYAVGSGTIEWFTEKYSIEQLLNPNVREMLGDKKQIAKFLAKNFVAEGSEEGASSVLEIGLDALLSAINGHESELEEKYNQLKGQIGEKNAFRTVLMDQLKQTGMEMLAGGVSGLLMASARVVENSLNQTSTGQQVRGAETSGSSGTDVIIDAALTLKEDAQSRILAEKMAEKREAGKMISDMELGRLVQNLQNDTNERIIKTAMTVVEDRAYELLGEENVQGNDQREKAQLIAKAVTDVDSLTKSERNQLIGDKAAFSVFKTFMTPNETSTELMGKVAEDTRTERQAQESVSELLGVKKRSTVDTSGVGEQVATAEDISRAVGTRVKGNEVILDGQFGKITGAIASTDGKNNGLKFRVNVNGHTQAVTPSQIKATDFGTAAIIREAAVNPGFYTADYANTLLHAQENGNVKNVGTFLADATKLRIAAYTGQMMPITGIDRTTAIEIYNSSAKEHGANRKAQVTGTDAGGKVMIDGATYGTEAWTEKLNEIKNKNAKAQIETIAGLFAPHGIAVTFKTAEQMARDYENLTGKKEDGTKIYGEEGPEGITINIEGLDYALGENGKPEAKGSHNMLVTFGHEMTHWLQRRSMQGYNNLETFVFNEMANNGMDLNNRVTQVMERLGLNLEDAMSEIVADSCDQILANESVRDHIQETNQSLFKEIKSFVTDLVGRIKTAVMGMSESQSRDARAMLNSANRLAKVWLGAYDEAISGTVAKGMIQEAEENPEKEFKMSRAVEMREDGLIAAHNLSEESLLEDLRMGGFPMPSIAVIGANRTWTGYGPISIFFGKESVDPMLGNAMYNGDAMTPTLGQANPQTKEEALEILRNKIERNTDRFGLMVMFREFKRVTNLDETREKAYRQQNIGAQQTHDEYMQLMNKEAQIIKDINQLRDDRGIKDYNKDKTYNRIAFGVLLAAEEMEGKSLSDEEKYQVIQRNVTDQLEQAGLQDFDLSTEDNGLYKQLVDFIDLASKQASLGAMMESKPNRILDFSEVKAVSLPKNSSAELIMALMDAGISREDMYFYPEGVMGAREKALKEIPKIQPEVRFSIAELQDGTKYVEVDTDQKQFEGMKPREMLAYASKVIKKKFVGKNLRYPDGKARIDNKTAGEYAYPRQRAMKEAEKRAKAKASPELDNLLKVGVELHPGDTDYPDYHGHDLPLNTIGYRYYKTLFRVNGRWFTGIVNIEQKKGFDRVKDITKIKEDTSRSAATGNGPATANNAVSAASANKNIPQNGQAGKTRLSRAQLDSEYQDAVESGDLAHAEEMLLEKLQRTEGIVAFNAPHGYGGQHKDIAKMIKNGTPEVVARAAADMAQYVPENAVLIPMPPHEGTVTESTDTMILARAIGELTGRPVINALGSNERESRYQAKAENRKGVTAEEMGFRQIAEIPEGTMPIFIDNVVGSGETAKAARNALGGGITLSYAKSTRSQGIEGLKRATVTYDKDGNLIPLSQRFDISKRDTRYSKANLAELDKRYMDAYNAYDDAEGEKVIAEMAEFAMPDSKVRDENGKLKVVYHQTNADPFTVFNMDKARQTEDVVGAFFAPEYDEYHEYGDRTYAVYLNITNPAYDVYDMDLSQEGAGLKKRNELIAQGYDGVINTEDGKVIEYVAFYPEQIKSAEAFTEDDDGDLIPLIQRFDRFNQDIRFSTAEPITNDQGEEIATILPGSTVDASRFSRASWLDDDERGKVIAEMKKLGYSDRQINKYLKDVDSVAAIIAADRSRLDFVADRSQKFLKDNSDVYVYTLDASTLCAKRLLYQGTFNAIQRQLPNTPLRPGDLIDLANMMYEMGYQTPCGICYVESKRRKTGDAVEDFLKNYKGEYIPNYADLTTTDGLAKLKQEHRQAYDDFIYAMNHRGAGSVKLVQTRTDYRGEVRKLTKNMVDYLNSVGGLRVQSFSDFETPHLLDMMQAVIDMNLKGLKSQAYTKVPNFAWVFGRTGIKINLSLMGDVDENGNLVFDGREGMKIEDAIALRNEYSKNVGTILVGKNMRHILAAMADDRIDFIIPFHSSGWTKEEFAKMKTLRGYEDFEAWQNERTIVGYTRDGRPKYKKTDSNIDPLSYWNYSKSGKWNAEKYLKLCAEQGIVPKFNQFLVDNGDGSYSLQADGSTDGYWKLLIDFKMYDNEGKGAPQQVVKPDFNMTEAQRVLSEYEGGANTLPIADPVVERYVREYKAKHPDQTRFSRVTSESMDVGSWMMGQTAGSVQTEAERQLLQDYRDLRISISLSIKRQLDYKEKIKRLEAREADLTPAERDDLIGLRNKLEIQQQKQADLENKLYKVTAADGWAGMMYHNNIVLNDFILGKTQDQVRESVEQMVDQVKAAEKIIAQQAKALRKMADSQAVRAVSSMINKKTLNYAVKSLKDMTNSAMGKTELESRLTEMALKRANGEDITEDAQELATDMTNRMRGYQNDVLERMRGVTITIGPDQQKEMKGKGMTLASVREQLKGTGVKVKYGDFSSLDTDTGDGGDLRTLLPELPQDIGENSGDALFKFISWAQSMRDTDTAIKQSMVDLEDTIASVMALTSTIEVNMNSPEYRKQNQMAAQTKQMAEDLEQAGKTLTDETDLAGKRAVGMASVLQRDVREAIRYYNTIARMAAQEEKTKVKKNVIEQLKSQHTADLIKQQMKYEKMMKDDRKARGIAEDNLQIRNRVNTVASRIRKRLMEETDLKNIPEEAKPLARQVLKMLVQHDYVGYRHILFADKQKREQTMRALDSWEKRDGAFKDEDLDWLIVGSGADADWTTYDMVVDALIDIEQGLLEYRTAEGHGLVTLMDRKAALKKIDEAVTNIWNVIAARETANINYKKMLISELAMQARDDMANSRFKGEWTGKIGHGIGAVRSGVVYGNMTPEYFFKNLRNGTLSMLYDEYHRAENRNGLEVGKAKEALARIAEETGYGTWDQEKRHTFKLEKGGTVNLTLGEMMSLYATWQRELMNQIEANGPETSFHLEVGGFYTAQEEQAKLLGREKFTQKAHRLTEEDMARIRDAMTPEQLEYVERVVKYITEDIGALGNEASMRMFGIKKYNEKWYFPFEVWSGVKSKKSDQGAAGNTENRAAHASFTKRRKSNAGNALVIRDFTQTAVKHIGGMINYNTFAPAIEFMNRVMNYQIEEAGEGEDSSTRRNIRTLFGEIYGKDALTYLENFNQDLNGGATRIERTAYDRLLSTFKKSAVAGSLSVALQQPLSYIRASMMISPKYLAAAINPAYYKGSRAEMEKYSGVAVIKNMGKFDMNLGQSAQDYMSPDRKESTGKKVYAKVSNAMTALPGAMDTMTWTRMWTAVKLEQQAKHPEMDHRSTEFMETVAERFNDVMRKTQVYDSVLVKSKNMRSINPFMKALTSFMAEPTLTANVLADAVVNRNEKGGKLNLAKAGATFILGAIAQALVKGVISAGRSPDEKKTWDENVMYRFAFNFMNEINPMGLIPGYSDLIETLKNGELQDDAMSVVGKIMSAVKTSINAVSGQSKSGWYRDVEDSVGQLAQMFTNVPAKNMMRDARAMWNFFVDQPYADRANSMAVLKYQQTDQFRNADNILGVINTWLGEKGWQTNNSAYFGRIYEADKAGKQQKVSEMMEYLKLARGTKESTVNTAIRGLIKQDDKLTEQQKLDWQKKYGLEKGSSYITDEYKKGNIDRKTAESMYRKENPKAEDKKVWETFDRIDYTNDGKLEDGQYYSSYLPLYDAIETGNQKEISNAVKKMLSYGYKKENIKKQLGEKYKAQYIAASVDERRRMVNKLTKAYKEIGVTAAEAQKIMQDWVLNDKKKQSKKK